jgi:cytochrome c553
VRDGRITRFEEITDSAAIAAAFAPADPARGRAYFTTCAGCHSPDGRGNRYMNAPNLTGIDAAYLVRQLRHFSALVRGGTSDFYGWQMNGRAKAMPSDRAIRDVVAYVGTLPVVKPVVTLKGDAMRGQALYATCAACHGAKAEGNPALGAPALALLDDWYQVRQLQGYRTGGRGTHASDTPGQQMRAALTVLRDDRALTDVVAYVTSLAPAD